MDDDEREGAHGKEDQQFLPIMRYGAGTFMSDRRHEFLICPLMAFAAGFDLVIAEDRGRWIVL